MRDGATARDVYAHALSYIKEKKPELERYFVKSIGFGMGMEFRDTAYLLSPKNSRPLRTGMVFCLSLGLQGLEEKDGKKYVYNTLVLCSGTDRFQVRSVAYRHGQGYSR
jgi:FACT complex subunit SPT16